MLSPMIARFSARLNLFALTVAVVIALMTGNVFGANHLSIIVQPSNTTAGVSVNPAVKVAIQNASNVTDTTATNSVTIALIGGGSGGVGAILSGTTTVNAVSGVATFNNLSVDKASTSYQLQITCSGLTQVFSGVFNIAAGPASKLAFTVQPVTTAAAAIITPSVKVTVQDVMGNTIATAANSISLSIGSNPSSGTLSGTATVAAVNGFATFSNLSINNAGSGYTLNAIATGLTGATLKSTARTHGD